MTGAYVLATLALFLASWAIFDLYIVARFGMGQGKTISEVVYNASLGHPGIPFLAGLVVGLLCGHLFSW